MRPRSDRRGPYCAGAKGDLDSGCKDGHIGSQLSSARLCYASAFHKKETKIIKLLRTYFALTPLISNNPNPMNC